MPEPELRLIGAERGELRRWAVWHEGRRLGVIVEKRLRGARSTFYEAIAPHPRTGHLVSLELNIDKAERVAALVRFDDDPNQFRQHWQYGLSDDGPLYAALRRGRWAGGLIV